MQEKGEDHVISHYIMLEIIWEVTKKKKKIEARFQKRSIRSGAQRMLFYVTKSMFRQPGWLKTGSGNSNWSEKCMEAGECGG